MTTGPLSTLPGEFSEQLREHLRRLLMHFDELRALAPQPGVWMPPVDLCEMEDAILVKVELPGVAIEDVRVTIHDSLLKIEGRKERASPASNSAINEEKPLRFLCLERSYGPFARTVSLKWMIEVQQVTARLANGILHIRLPKAQGCGREIVIPITEEFSMSRGDAQKP
jgi:HSP20 family molecular chaperone IbpA